MSRRRTRLTFQTVALVGAAVLIGLLTILKRSTGEGDETEVRPSTFLSGAPGAKALFLTAEELGLKVERWMLPFPEEGVEGALAVVSPTEPLLTSEAELLWSWVEEGGRLFYVPAPAGRDPFLARLGLELTGVAAPPVPLPPLSPRRKEPAGRTVQREPQPEEEPPAGEAARLVHECPLRLKGFQSLLSQESDSADTTEVLYSSEDGLAGLLWLTAGRGRILLLSDPRPLLNRGIADSGAAAPVLRGLAELAGGGPLWFDEFHHGYDERGGLERAAWRFLSSSTPGWALLQLAGLGLAGLFFAGLRLGPPLPPPPPPRRSSLEHVQALAAAYLAARARTRPAALLLEGLRARLGAHTAEELRLKLVALAEVDPAVAGPVGEILALREPGGRSRIELVRLARSLDQVLAAARDPEVQSWQARAGRSR